MLGRSKVTTLMPVKNMGRAVKFYTKSLGAKVVMLGSGDMKDEWASLKIGGHEVWFVRPDKTEKRELAYTTFQVQNIRTVVKGLMKKGVKFEKAEDLGPGSTVEGPISFAPWGSSAFFHDSEGNALMLWQDA